MDTIFIAAGVLILTAGVMVNMRGFTLPSEEGAVAQDTELAAAPA